MRKFIMLLVVFSFGAALHVHAQSLTNSNWKGYFGDPLNDSLTWHMKTDSSYVTMSSGQMIVSSKITVSKDTLTISDVDGQHACPGMDGVYKYAIIDNVLTFTLVSDPCEGRNAITTIKWMKTQ